MVCGTDQMPQDKAREGWWCSRFTGHTGPCATHPPDKFLDTLSPTERAFYEPHPAMPHVIDDQTYNLLLTVPPSTGTLPVIDTPKPANPKQAYGNKKLPVHLVPPALVLGVAVALGEGAVKYGAYNWRETRIEALTYVGAMLRHLYAWMDGEDVDPESSVGKTHIQGIAACCAILLDCIESGQLIDNRPPKGPAPRLVLTPKESK